MDAKPILQRLVMYGKQCKPHFLQHSAFKLRCSSQDFFCYRTFFTDWVSNCREIIGNFQHGKVVRWAIDFNCTLMHGIDKIQTQESNRIFKIAGLPMHVQHDLFFEITSSIVHFVQQIFGIVLNL